MRRSYSGTLYRDPLVASGTGSHVKSVPTGIMKVPSITVYRLTKIFPSWIHDMVHWNT